MSRSLLVLGTTCGQESVDPRQSRRARVSGHRSSPPAENWMSERVDAHRESRYQPLYEVMVRPLAPAAVKRPLQVFLPDGEANPKNAKECDDQVTSSEESHGGVKRRVSWPQLGITRSASEAVGCLRKSHTERYAFRCESSPTNSYLLMLDRTRLAQVI
jgi:hypothetical protein